MREEVIFATGVEIERLAEVFHRHRRALDVPAGISAAPRRIPLLQVTWLRGTPEREVERVPLVRVHLDARSGLTAVRRLGVQPRAVSREGGGVEVHAIGCD